MPLPGYIKGRKAFKIIINPDPSPRCLKFNWLKALPSNANKAALRDYSITAGESSLSAASMELHHYFWWLTFHTTLLIHVPPPGLLNQCASVSPFIQFILEKLESSISIDLRLTSQLIDIFTWGDIVDFCIICRVCSLGHSQQRCLWIHNIKLIILILFLSMYSFTKKWIIRVL